MWGVTHVYETEAKGQIVSARNVKLLEEAHQPHYRSGSAPGLGCMVPHKC